MIYIAGTISFSEQFLKKPQERGAIDLSFSQRLKLCHSLGEKLQVEV